ncbi:uncharacterized protein LOC144624764 [Crassostrea virginica]
MHVRRIVSNSTFTTFIPAYHYLGRYKAAINPYSSSILANLRDCEPSCSSDPNCNGYSIDTSNNGCYLSKCNSYDDVPSCSSCLFASKSSPTSIVVCTPETSTSDDSATTTPGADTSSEPATTPDRGMSTTVSTDVNGVDGHTSSATSRQVQITSNVTCVCVCEDVNITLQESIDKRKKELIINKKELSSSIRKLTSAEDSRVSSRNIGVMDCTLSTYGKGAVRVLKGAGISVAKYIRL